MVLLLLIAFSGLGYRLVDIQMFNREPWVAKAETNTHRVFFKAPLRGRIFDSRQTLLAGSEKVKTVCADPSLIGTNLPVSSIIARALAPILDMPENALMERFQPATRVRSNGEVVKVQSVVLKKKVPLAVYETVRETMRSLDFGVAGRKLSREERDYHTLVRRYGVFAEDVEDQERVYPNDSLAAHVLGLVRDEQRAYSRFAYGDTVGVSGVEHLLNTALTGTPGWRKTEVARTRELMPFRDQDIQPRNGHDVILTLDAGVQHILETELRAATNLYKPASVMGIVVRPRTGEILALANLPTFDPNHPGASPPDHWRNRAITDTYEPGSTFKVVAVAAALNDGLVTLQSRIDCEHGYWIFAKRRLKDDHPMGIATVEDILARSSNIGTAKLGLAMGKERLHEYIRAFGFGEPTGLGLAGEVRGILHPHKKWSQLQASRVPIGQGIAVTPLQMVMAMAAIANEGRLMQPYLVDRLVDAEGRVVLRNGPRVVRQVIEPSAARDVVTALKKVASVDGTAKRAILEHYTVAGKTGTAERPENGAYAEGRYVGSFVGFFPADQPELCIGIVMDDLRPPTYYGGLTAAPTFQKVAERAAKYLAIKSDVTPPDKQLAGATNQPGAPSHAQF